MRDQHISSALQRNIGREIKLSTVNRVKYRIKILLEQKMYFARQFHYKIMIIGN